MIKRPARFLLMLAASLLLVPFLPLYVERTMVRSWRTDRVGDVIEWGWRARTLSGYWSDYKYFRPEQRPALWLGVNLALAFVYALVVVLCVDYVLARLGRRAAAEDKRVV